MSDPEDGDPADGDPEDPEAAQRDAQRKQLQRQRELRLRKARRDEELEATKKDEELEPTEVESDSGVVTLWTLLGMGYYILVEAVVGLLSFALANVVPVVIPLFLFMGPLMAYWMAASLLKGEEKSDERKGLKISLSLFYGLAILSPCIICAGMIMFK